MLSKEQQELLEAFSEQPTIGQELSEKLIGWNENNVDEDKVVGQILPEMSGDSVVISYLEAGYSEKELVAILTSIGFSLVEDSDDLLEQGIEPKQDVDEYLSSFLLQCIEVSHAYPCFVKDMFLVQGDAHRKEEVRIIISSDIDFRKLPSTNARKILFMHFLKDIREKAKEYSMIDESLCFCNGKKEFILIFKPLNKTQWC